MKIFFTYLLAFLPFLILSCSKKNFSSKTNYKFRSKDGKPDYADINYWAAHPWKWDPSDSVPRDLEASYVRDSVADVFFIHPTTLTSNRIKESNAEIDDSRINSKPIILPSFTRPVCLTRNAEYLPPGTARRIMAIILLKIPRALKKHLTSHTKM
jgi:hypothetical protein